MSNSNTLPFRCVVGHEIEDVVEPNKQRQRQRDSSPIFVPYKGPSAKEVAQKRSAVDVDFQKLNVAHVVSLPLERSYVR